MKKKDFIQNIAIIAVLALLVIILRTFVFTPVVVSGNSMDPTLLNNERVIALKNQEIKRFAIVTLKAPDDTNENYVKRVIGLPGDHLQVMEDVLYINGQPVNESYLQPQKKHLLDQEAFTNDFTLQNVVGVETIPKNMYFVMGDNRKVSKDSRAFGLINKNDIFGVVRFAYWPLNRFGPVSDVVENN
ncbi:MAG: signal peptidase I [Streptococcaceae bacterium]|nr:signal peptidase I [Streptococcaceae bacterium]